MNYFSIEAFVKECKAAMTGWQNREQANRQLLETYCAYLQQHTRSTHHG